MKLDLWNLRHPDYAKFLENWTKCRLVYGGGEPFKNAYLQKFSRREKVEDFNVRKSLTYNPGFAGTIIDEIKNSIYLRMSEITRKGGPATYQESLAGKGGGVDLLGGSMNNFMGQMVLPELLIMGKIGIYIDMPAINPATVADLGAAKPYLYTYTAEQIYSWNYQYICDQQVITSLLLHETMNHEEEEYGLITGNREQMRLLQLKPEGVWVSFFDTQNELIGQPILLKGMKRIPFVVLEITKSLLRDIADYQIALLNIESSDLKFILDANFAFYTEQYDPRADAVRQAQGSSDDPSQKDRTENVEVGITNARRYPMGTDRPEFINPSPEPLKASMEKQAQMKNDMRKLANLALTSVEPKFASAESKQMDDRSLESGLSYIGLELERGERMVAEAWCYYMGADLDFTVKYPRKYSLITAKDRRENSKSLSELKDKVQSKTYSKEVGKLLAKELLEAEVNDTVLDAINAEIDDAQYINSDAVSIASDIQSGLVDAVTASNARGYDGKTVVPIAKEEHTQRLAEIAKAQSAPKGISPGTDVGNKDQKTQSQDPNNDPNHAKGVRGTANG